MSPVEDSSSSSSSTTAATDSIQRTPINSPFDTNRRRPKSARGALEIVTEASEDGTPQPRHAMLDPPMSRRPSHPTLRQVSASTSIPNSPGTQALRRRLDGPPQSFSYTGAISSANHSAPDSPTEDDYDTRFTNATTEFRSPWERSQTSSGPPKRARESWINIDTEALRRKLSENPFGRSVDDHHSKDVGKGTPQEAQSDPESPTVAVPPGKTKRSSTAQSSAGGWDVALRNMGRVGRVTSLPHIQTTGESTRSQEGSSEIPIEPITPGQRRWDRLRSMIRNPSRSVVGAGQTVAGPSSAIAPHVTVVDDLIAGPLIPLVLGMFFERDEQDDRRVPVLLHHLRIRVSDSIHPLHGTHAMFRIECDYANSTFRWVIYRELRDFVSLHTHYRVANVYTRSGGVELPEFPLNSIWYFKFLNKDDRGKDTAARRAEFARIQRKTLEDYLISLIRAVMFRPESNRLSRFLEITSLAVILAQRGSVQYKAGFLWILSSNSSRKATHSGITGWIKQHEPKWWAVRESYLIAVEDVASTKVFDVFLLDADFSIERPRRYYRQGLNLLRGEDSEEEDNKSTKTAKTARSTAGTIRRIFQRNHQEHDMPLPNTSAPSLAGHPEVASPFSSDDDEMGDMTGPRMEEAMQQVAGEASATPKPKSSTEKPKDVSQHTFYIQNSQRRLKMVAKNERQMRQWIVAMERMSKQSVWNKPHRFDSFAPIRYNVAAQWLVDGRDYFWNLSRAILLAKEKIYIHDWWLSPEIYLRRPGKENYRLDRLLKRKAEEGVKIFVILYKEVSNRTTPTDSNYAKQQLMGLHPNIMVQRSPSHFVGGTFYWAHHEKMCVIDDTVAFMGGLDLCFGRWDTPQHVLIDDAEHPTEQIWAGKDYSNARVSDFHTLNKPEQDMYDRTKVPRMPWHDVAMQMVGAPARDLCRHFVQRWNHLLRVKNHSRVMPFLIPPAEYRGGELANLGLTGTCEVQICRSAGPWSMGTTTDNRIEHSIQNAYLKAIQLSYHFVYIENQFFITSTVVDDTTIENKIGDALVSRIIRAHQEKTPWRAIIVIPVLPGFAFPIGHNDASAIRLIVECQNRSISRGPNSIFGRLRKEGIEPGDYISFFSLRAWDKMNGDLLATEQVYIHAKCMIVDDRLVIIGSANINERSMRGDRDSELATVVRDTDMIHGTMAGKPFPVGRFAHSLRVRLMREHLGVDVDAMYEEDFKETDPVMSQAAMNGSGPQLSEDYFQQSLKGDNASHVEGDNKSAAEPTTDKEYQKFSDAVEQRLDSPDDQTPGKTINQQCETHLTQSVDASILSRTVDADPDVTYSETSLIDNLSDAQKASGLSVSTPRDREEADHCAMSTAESEDTRVQHPLSQTTSITEVETASLAPTPQNPFTKLIHTLLPSAPPIDPRGFEDPLDDKFYKMVWLTTAVQNTEIFRKVFHITPDDNVSTWKQYKEAVQLQERIVKPSKDAPCQTAASGAGGDGGIPPSADTNPTGITHDLSHHIQSSVPGAGQGEMKEKMHQAEPNVLRRTFEKDKEKEKEALHGGTSQRRRARLDEPMEQWEKDELEEMLKGVRGHLVVFPTRFLEGEDLANNFLFNADKLLPLPIYN